MPDALSLPRPPARRAPVAALLGVLALHAVLLLLATRLGVWPDRVSARGPLPQLVAPLVLWLLDRPTPQPATLADPPPAQRHRPRKSDARVSSAPRSPLPAPVEPQAISLPAAAAETPAAPSRAAESAGPPNPAPPALNLTLPRAASSAWRARSPALDDARANTRTPVNLATLIDKALGGDPYGAISEEHLSDGSVRFRRGSQCVISRPNQAQNIDPFNGSVLPKPRLLDKC